MSLEFLELFYHEGKETYSIFLQYFVDDGNNFGRKADKIIEVNSIENLTKELIGLVRNNISVIDTLKFDIGNYSHFDMFLNVQKFTDDIEEILLRIGNRHSEKAYLYVNTFKNLMDIIVDLEMSYFPVDMVRKYSDLMISAFTKFGYSFLVEYDIDYQECLIEGAEHHEITKFNLYKGIPLIFCLNHEVEMEQIIFNMEMIYDENSLNT